MSEMPYHCAHNRKPHGCDRPTYGQRIKVFGEHAKPQGTYHCNGGGAGCAVYDALGCWPSIAECRYASHQEPRRDASSHPKIVEGVLCLGEDHCVKEKCSPEPRFKGDYL